MALDDVVSLVAYSIAISIALAGSGSRGSGFETIGKPILVNLFVLALGGFFGFVLKLLFRKRSTDNRLIVSLATLLRSAACARFSMCRRFWAACRWAWCIST